MSFSPGNVTIISRDGYIFTNEIFAPKEKRRDSRRSSSTTSTTPKHSLWFLRYLSRFFDTFYSRNRIKVTSHLHHAVSENGVTCILPSRIFLVKAIKETKMARKVATAISRFFSLHPEREQENETSWVVGKTFAPRSRQFQLPNRSHLIIPDIPLISFQRPCLQLCRTFRVTGNWMEQASSPRKRNRCSN